MSDNNQVLFNTNQLATWDGARTMRAGSAPGPSWSALASNPKPAIRPPAGSTSQLVRRAGRIPGAQLHRSPDRREIFLPPLPLSQWAQGMNVGLIMDKFRRYPNSPAYVSAR